MVTAHNTFVAKYPIQWYLGGTVAVIQKGTCVWVGLPSTHDIYRRGGQCAGGFG